MIQRFIAWIRGVIQKMLHINDATQALKVEIAVSPKMQTAIDLWAAMFREEAPWLSDTVKSLGLPGAVAGELARLTTIELSCTVDGGPRADYLAEQLQPILDALHNTVEVAGAGGSTVFKPYVDGGVIAVDCVPAWRFLPTSFNSRGEVTGAVFPEQVQRGKVYYTRMEQHQLTDTGYVIRNLAFRSDSEATLGVPCALADVDEWASLEPELTIKYKDGSAPAGMLFAVFRVPQANAIEPGSPLGMSVYSRAVGLIEEADKQYSRILWEYEGSELAVDASDGAILKDASGRDRMPQGKMRLFRSLGLDRGQSGDLYEVFSPEIRDSSLFNGLNQLLRRIEFNCNLTYGTLSDPQNVDKTAEEIRSGKQRSYAAVCEMQTALESALRHLLWCMDFYASLYNLAPRGDYEAAFSWGDGIMEDVDKEFARRMQLADKGYIDKAAVVAWYFDVSEEEARKMMPAETPGIGLE